MKGDDILKLNFKIKNKANDIQTPKKIVYHNVGTSGRLHWVGSPH